MMSDQTKWVLISVSNWSVDSCKQLIGWSTDRYNYESTDQLIAHTDQHTDHTDQHTDHTDQHTDHNDQHTDHTDQLTDFIDWY